MKNRRQIILTFGAALSCVAAPYLCRIPRGWDWVSQYPPNEYVSFWGFLFFLGLSAIPAVVVFGFGLTSKPPQYTPLAVSISFALISLVYWHRNNDMTADAQAGLSLLFIPVYSAGAAIIGGVVGVGFQSALDKTKR